MSDVFGRGYRPQFRRTHEENLATFIYNEGCLCEILSEKKLLKLAQTVKFTILQRHANPNMVDNNMNSPLHWAAYWGWSGVIQILVKTKNKDTPPTNVNPINKDGVTPLHLAVQRKHYRTVKRLLHHKAQITQDMVTYAAEEEDNRMIAILLPAWKEQSKKTHAWPLEGEPGADERAESTHPDRAPGVTYKTSSEDDRFPTYQDFEQKYNTDEDQGITRATALLDRHSVTPGLGMDEEERQELMLSGQDYIINLRNTFMRNRALSDDGRDLYNVGQQSP
jgi:hypothetical protein